MSEARVFPEEHREIRIQSYLVVVAAMAILFTLTYGEYSLLAPGPSSLLMTPLIFVFVIIGVEYWQIRALRSKAMVVTPSKTLYEGRVYRRWHILIVLVSLFIVLTSMGGFLRPPYIVKVMNSLVDEDAIITVDSGDNTFWFGRSFVTSKQRIQLSGYLGTMAFGFPAALGAQIAFPEKQVVCVTGDGGFSMVMTDFTTAIKYDIPVKAILFDNGELAMISVEQRTEGYPKFSTELVNPDFADYANSCGGLGIRTESSEKLKSDLERTLNHKGPALLDIVTDPKRF